MLSSYAHAVMSGLEQAEQAVGNNPFLNRGVEGYPEILSIMPLISEISNGFDMK